MPNVLIKLSVDGKHLWIGDYCCSFEQAKQQAHEILDLINGAEAEKEIKDAAGVSKKPG